MSRIFGEGLRRCSCATCVLGLRGGVCGGTEKTYSFSARSASPRELSRQLNLTHPLLETAEPRLRGGLTRRRGARGGERGAHFSASFTLTKGRIVTRRKLHPLLFATTDCTSWAQSCDVPAMRSSLPTSMEQQRQ